MKRLAVVLLLALPLSAQSDFHLRDAIRWKRPELLREFTQFLRIENVALNNAKGHADIQRNADFIVKMLEKRGVKGQVLNVEGGFPSVYGELLTPGATKTVVFYAHFDGQPVDPSKWKTPPFEPTLLDEKSKSTSLDSEIFPNPENRKSDDFRLYARGASDDKAGVFGLIAALDALKNTLKRPSVNIKFFFEGEEEAGSEHLGAILARYSELLKSDLWILCDGPIHQSGKLQLVYGARGVMGLELTVYGPNRALHSGHYGNWSPNPALDLAHILAGMRDQRGRVSITGFYDDVRKPTVAEERALAAFPDVDEALKKELKPARTMNTLRVERGVLEPAINIRGIRAGNVGEAAANAVMTEAKASIDFRLVPNQSPGRVENMVTRYFQSLGWEVTSNRPIVYDGPLPTKGRIDLQWQTGYPPTRTSFDAPAAQAMVRTIEAAFPQQKPLLQLPTLGGSVPAYLFEQQFKVPVMILPIANYDNNQHAANENIRLGHLWQGIELYAALMAGLGENWK